jgi:D-aminoacyl-tRNA deacylase
VRIVLQRVAEASVAIADRTVGRIDRGFCILLGVTHDDTLADAEWLAEKVAGLRIFNDAEDRMNLSLAEVGGAVLVISQFTLYGDAAKGRRPSFVGAARPEQAVPLYEAFVAALRARGLTVATGEFGAQMMVDIRNDGPVTLILERTAS